MRVYKDFPLSEILYYKIGGEAKVLLKIENKEDLLQALDFIKKEKHGRILPIGLGSNLLLNDNFFDGVVLWFCSGKSSTIRLNSDNLVEVFAAESLDDIINFSFNNNLIGLEWAGGLPSTIGGAVRGNVGAFGGEISRSVERIEVFEVGQNGEFVQKTLGSLELEFGYRDSIIKKNKNMIVSSAVFKLTKADDKTVEQARNVYLSRIEYRNKNHPMEHPSCGSVFKNITKREDVEKVLSVWRDVGELSQNKWYNKVSSGYIINRLGFSGFTIGGAKVSERHGNYIVNFRNARFDDVLGIIEKIKEKFYKTFGFYPELEVEVVR